MHFEDQLSSEKKCGHLGGKVLVPTAQAVRNLVAARLAADVAGTPTVLIARTDAHSANLLTSDVDERDRWVPLGAVSEKTTAGRGERGKTACYSFLFNHGLAVCLSCRHGVPAVAVTGLGRP